MKHETSCLQVAVFAPLRRIFSYACPASGPLPAGVRVRVPFASGNRIAMVLGMGPCPPGVEVKDIQAVLDSTPILDPALQRLIAFGAAYYQHAIGDVWATALPAALRKGQPLPDIAASYHLSAAGCAALQRVRGKRQRALLDALQTDGMLAPATLEAGLRPALREAVRRGWAQAVAAPIPALRCSNSPFHLHQEQQAAVAVLRAAEGFSPILLQGVTGSGKTEVYLETLRPRLEAGGQALVLVPEISLTPQLLDRFSQRFGKEQVAALHSGQSDGERLRTWAAAREGRLRVIIGTRSAVFVPLPRLAMIVVDEEHDPSFKQQTGWHYSARDLAIQRARLEGCPIVLGSATPSLESLHNVDLGRYRTIHLRQRAGGAQAPAIALLPLRRQGLQGGLSGPLLGACAATLAAGNQVLLFLNRRGYAPALLCHDCGHVFHCPRCAAALIWHRRDARLRCHHCGHEERLPRNCPQCGSAALIGAGQGTEQLEDVLRERFPDTPIWRVDRDALRGREALENVVREVRRDEPAILVGTQILAKGHHFPAVTLVGIVNTDQGLFSADFRAPERLLQTVLQVAGRAGRAERPGRVLLQTHHPEHPLLQALLQGDYSAPAAALLAERVAAGLPPATALAVLRAEAHQRSRVETFLQGAAGLAPAGLEVSGPLPSLLERRAGFERAELWAQAGTRAVLQRLLSAWLQALEALPQARQVRWQIDVDPLSF
ncbi:MAG: primosomal protein N' [Gammaproteobacteria bacterium]|nr:primosomal protein N' [Gammaproteobacteria bacterium]